MNTLYVGIKEIINRKEEVIYSETDNGKDNQMDFETDEISKTPNLTQTLDEEYREIEKENSTIPRKSVSEANNINANNVHKSFKHMALEPLK